MKQSRAPFEGVMEKKGRVRWKTRYFVLDGVSAERFVSYMAEKGKSVVAPAGSLFLALSVLIRGWSWATFFAAARNCE